MLFRCFSWRLTYHNCGYLWGYYTQLGTPDNLPGEVSISNLNRQLCLRTDILPILVAQNIKPNGGRKDWDSLEFDFFTFIKKFAVQMQIPIGGNDITSATFTALRRRISRCIPKSWLSSVVLHEIRAATRQLVLGKATPRATAGSSCETMPPSMKPSTSRR